jgi:hypothetical protein
LRGLPDRERRADLDEKIRDVGQGWGHEMSYDPFSPRAACLTARVDQIPAYHS